MKIILASQSPFRKQALEILGLEYEVMPSNIDESAIRHENPHVMAQMLSEAKAAEISKNQNDAIIIAADLFIVHKNQIMEKPVDLEEAKKMLFTLSGSEFDIVSGLAVFNSETKKLLGSSDSCKVTFRKLLEYEIDNYISRYSVTTMAGAFEADGLLRFSEKIEGNYNFKTGLAVNKLIEFLRENDINV